jgi:hypothetical protein
LRCLLHGLLGRLLHGLLGRLLRRLMDVLRELQLPCGLLC